LKWLVVFIWFHPQSGKTVSEYWGSSIIPGTNSKKKHKNQTTNHLQWQFMLISVISASDSTSNISPWLLKEVHGLLVRHGAFGQRHSLHHCASFYHADIIKMDSEASEIPRREVLNQRHPMATALSIYINIYQYI
jgi:hypothetical protein